MRKFIYLLFALLTFACNNEGGVFSEENNKCFHSTEEFNTFVQSAIQTYSIRKTKSADKEIISLSVIDCIKKAAISKGIQFETKNNGENNELILFSSEDPNIRYGTTSTIHRLWHDKDLPDGGDIALIVWCTFKYHISTYQITEICGVSPEVRVPSFCPYLRDIDFVSFSYNISESQTGIFYNWSETITIHNPITDKDQQTIYHIGGTITLKPNG